MPMNQYSFASAPASPAATRRSSQHGGPPPVTPQRITRSAPRPASQYFHSPRTPATNNSTPYTPLSLRSFSSNGSTLRTPTSPMSRRVSLTLSPEVGLRKNQSQKSLADIAYNWRNKASENGITVTSSQESQYADDEASEYNPSEAASPPLNHKEALFAPTVVATQRRARALSYAPPPPRTPLNSMPAEICTPNRQTLVNLNTPPPNASVINKLKMKGNLTEPPAPRRRQLAQPTASELFDIDEDEYAPYPPAFSAPTQQYGFPIPIYDPFNVPTLPTITEAARDNYEVYSHHNQREKSGCSICGSEAATLAILEPCSHPLCSACLTSALNIVGDKDLECAVCRASVANFHLKSTSAHSSPAPAPRTKFSNSDAAKSLLPSAFDVNPFYVPQPQFSERMQGTSTPITYDSQPVVLRIDNVPWDITPPTLTAWLKQPVERVHVLLDRKGKTLSHVFVEMAGEEEAKIALRTAQNSVLGKGKRARGVTVTRSSQEELMKALFPSWQGHFDGSRPSLAGLTNEAVVSTLQAGLISEGELHALLHLIRSPDSHFVKVPSLPFYSLISMLSKFPADVDSRVFWSGALRDFLYDITYAAIQTLLAHDMGDPELLPQLVQAGTRCQAFTEHQAGKLSDLVDRCVHDTITSSVNTSHCDLRSSTGSSPGGRSSTSPFGRGICSERQFEDLAREFGVGSKLVEALAHRLSAMC